MGKLKVGDRFRVKNGLKGGEFYDGLFFTDDMEKYCDKVFTVSGFGYLNNYNSKETEGYVFNDAMIEPVSNQSNTSREIHITIVGNTSIAVLKDGKNVVKRTFATCNPTDTFDFNIGAKLAFERLMGASVDKPIQKDFSEIEVGDKIKIVKKGCHGPELKIGDVHTVTRMALGGGIYTDRENVFYRYERDEFVVISDESEIEKLEYREVRKTYTQSEVNELIKAERERIKESVEHLFKEKC